MHVAVVENTRVTHYGQVAVALAEAGARFEVFRPWADGGLPTAPDGHDALVVFGGEQNARADATHPYLPALARRMRDFAEAGRSVLGICLGAQVFARGLAAENLIGAAPEFGWCDVTLTDAGRDDPVLRAAGRAFPIFQWHSDTFTLPDGAVRLAEAAGAQNQAFRIGRAGYGTQFHFEANRAVVADWNRTFPDAVDSMAPGWRARHADEARTRGAEADAAGLALARAWVATIEA